MKTAIIFILAIYVSSCTPKLVITSDRDSSAVFVKYQSYAWSLDQQQESVDNPQYDNDLNRRRIERAIETEMKNRNFRRDEDTPDLLIDYHIIIKGKHGYTVNENDMHRFEGSDKVTVYNYQEGALIIHLVDNSTGHLVWQGSASRVISQPVKDVEKKIDDVVSKIFTNYPKPN